MTMIQNDYTGVDQKLFPGGLEFFSLAILTRNNVAEEEEMAASCECHSHEQTWRCCCMCVLFCGFARVGAVNLAPLVRAASC